LISVYLQTENADVFLYTMAGLGPLLVGFGSWTFSRKNISLLIKYCRFVSIRPISGMWKSIEMDLFTVEDQSPWHCASYFSVGIAGPKKGGFSCPARRVRLAAGRVQTAECTH